MPAVAIFNVDELLEKLEADFATIEQDTAEELLDAVPITDDEDAFWG